MPPTSPLWKTPMAVWFSLSLWAWIVPSLSFSPRGKCLKFAVTTGTCCRLPRDLTHPSTPQRRPISLSYVCQPSYPGSYKASSHLDFCPQTYNLMGKSDTYPHREKWAVKCGQSHRSPETGTLWRKLGWLAKCHETLELLACCLRCGSFTKQRTEGWYSVVKPKYRSEELPHNFSETYWNLVYTLSPLFPVVHPILRETRLISIAFQRKIWLTFSSFKEMHSGLKF